MATTRNSTNAVSVAAPKTLKTKTNGKANGKLPVQAEPQAKATASLPITPPIQAMSSDGPFAATNFAAEGDQVPTGIDDLNIEVGAPSDEEFVLVSSDPRHMLKANMLVVNREDGYGKSYFLLTPPVAAFVKSQPSLKKFLKPMRIFLYITSEG